MKAKLDENLDLRLAPLIAEGGNDVDSVLGEGLSGRRDEAIYEACRASDRALFTLDLDFPNPFRFPPEVTEGIVVIRPPRPVLPLIRAMLVSVLPRLRSLELRGKLWIVEPGRLRMYDPDETSSAV